MTDESADIRLDGLVAIVTGAGRGLGAAYAHELARRGAAVVVNDLGTDGDGSGENAECAEAVVAAIVAQGGRAIGDDGDVTSEADMERLASKAREAFGGIDIVVANAGICGSNPFISTSLDEFRRYWEIHVAGTINIVRAAWPMLLKSRSPRIVMTESAAGLYGMAGQASYAAAKGAVHGLMRTLAIEGAESGILVNSITPGGYSRMHDAAIKDPAMLEATRHIMPASLAASVAVWLASPACSFTGQVFSGWGGRAARVAIGPGRGYYDPALSVEMLVQHADEVGATTAMYEPTDSLDEVVAWQSGRFAKSKAESSE